MWVRDRGTGLFAGMLADPTGLLYSPSVLYMSAQL
jgi:hypothetical protein